MALQPHRGPTRDLPGSQVSRSWRYSLTVDLPGISLVLRFLGYGATASWRYSLTVDLPGICLVLRFLGPGFTVLAHFYLFL